MNRDPLAEHFARRRIDRARYLAREFQKHFAIADKRRPVDLERERPDDQSAAWKWLAKAYRALGADESALVNDALIRSRTTKQIMESRGRTGPEWEPYFAKRVWECLGTLAVVYGFEREKKIRASGTKTQTLARNNKTWMGCSGSNASSAEIPHLRQASIRPPDRPIGGRNCPAMEMPTPPSDHTPLGWRRRHRDAAERNGS